MAPPMAAPALPPAPPANLESGDFGLREVTLSWSAAAGAERVRIERAARADGPFLPLETVSAARGRYTDRGGAAGLSDNTTYYYRLVALGATGLASPPSTVVESMTAPPPDPPATLRAAAPAARAARIEWNAPRAEGVEKYCIERCNAAAGNEWTDCGRVAQCCFAEGGSPKSPLADSTAYRYRVASVNRVGAVGAWSAPVTVTTRPPPEIVGGLAAKRGEVRCVPLTWQAAHENDIVAYEIERRGPLDEDFQPLATLRGAPSVSYLDGRRIPGSLGDDQTFFYRIRARNAVGACGAWCEPVEATTRPPPPPVTGLAALGGLPRAVELTWDPSPDEKVAGYVVERGEGDEKGYVEIARLAGIAATRLLDRAGASASAPCGRLRDGADYRYRVRACNVAKALSEWCAPMAARTKPAPAAPAAVTATATLGRRVELAWQANAEEDIANYVVESREAGSSRWREVARTDKTALTHGGLDDNERRDYRVKARDRDTLESAWSTVAAGGTRPLPPAPEDLAVTWRDGQAVLTWQAPAGVTATGYRVWKRTMLGLMSARLGETAVCEFAMAPATIGRKVAVEVTALDDEGLESARSAALEIVPPPSPVAEALQAKKTGDEH